MEVVFLTHGEISLHRAGNRLRYHCHLLSIFILASFRDSRFVRPTTSLPTIFIPINVRSVAAGGPCAVPSPPNHPSGTGRRVAGTTQPAFCLPCLPGSCRMASSSAICTRRLTARTVRRKRMQFTFTAEQEEFRSVLRRFLEEKWRTTAVRQ